MPPQVIKTVNGYTKVFLGELVERARDVRGERGGRRREQEEGSGNGRGNPIGMGYGDAGGTAASMISAGQSDDEGGQLPTPAGTQPRDDDDNNNNTLNAPVRQQPPEVEEQLLGPLTPDDFREAVRRYRKRGDGAGTGLQGLSLPLGVGGKGTGRLGGRRLLG